MIDREITWRFNQVWKYVMVWLRWLSGGLEKLRRLTGLTLSSQRAEYVVSEYLQRKHNWLKCRLSIDFHFHEFGGLEREKGMVKFKADAEISWLSVWVLHFPIMQVDSIFYYTFPVWQTPMSFKHNAPFCNAACYYTFVISKPKSR